MIPVHAVVMAAGEGRRLRPLTERWPKPVLPVDGRPVLATLLRELAAAGIEDAWIVVGHLAQQVEALAGDGAGFGLRVRYAHQPEALGSADAVSRAVAAGAQPPLLVTAADTVYTAGDLGAAVARWQEAGTQLGLGVRLGDDPRPEHTPVRVEDGRVAALGEGEATAAPLWFFGAEAVAALEDVPGPPYALATVLERTLAAGGEVTALPLAPTSCARTSRIFGRGRKDGGSMSESETYDLYKQGREQMKKGMNAQATVALEKAKRREPGKASIREALGIAYFRIRRFEEAEREFRALVDMKPVDDYAHFALGRCLEKQGRPEEAAGHYRLATTMSPGSADYRRALDGLRRAS